MSSVLTLKPNLRWCPPNYKGNLISTWEQPRVRGMCVKSHLRVLYGAVQHKRNTALLWMRVGTSDASSREMVNNLKVCFLKIAFWFIWGIVFPQNNQSLGGEDPLEKGMATTPVFLPGESHEQEDHSGLLSIGPQRVGHNWSYLAHRHTPPIITNLKKLITIQKENVMW